MKRLIPNLSNKVWNQFGLRKCIIPKAANGKKLSQDKEEEHKKKQKKNTKESDNPDDKSTKAKIMQAYGTDADPNEVAEKAAEELFVPAQLQETLYYRSEAYKKRLRKAGLDPSIGDAEAERVENVPHHYVDTQTAKALSDGNTFRALTRHRDSMITVNGIPEKFEAGIYYNLDQVSDDVYSTWLHEMSHWAEDVLTQEGKEYNHKLLEGRLSSNLPDYFYKDTEIRARMMAVIINYLNNSDLYIDFKDFLEKNRTNKSVSELLRIFKSYKDLLYYKDNFVFRDKLSPEEELQMMNLNDINTKVDLARKGGKTKILIKKSNRGKFTDYCGGQVTDACIAKAKASGNKKLIKRATFALNARKWNHKVPKGLEGLILEPIMFPTQAANLIRNRLYNNITPFGFDDPFNRLYGAIKGEPDKYMKENLSNIKNGDPDNSALDAIWAEYLSIPNNQRHKLLPGLGIAKNNDGSFRILGDGVMQEDVDMAVNQIPVGERRSWMNRILGNYAIGLDKDAGGEYVYYSDSELDSNNNPKINTGWDINPFSNSTKELDYNKKTGYYGLDNNGFLYKVCNKLLGNFDDISCGIGHAVPIYNKQYLWDYYGIPEDTQSHFLPEIIVTPDSYKGDDNFEEIPYDEKVHGSINEDQKAGREPIVINGHNFWMCGNNTMVPECE